MLFFIKKMSKTIKQGADFFAIRGNFKSHSKNSKDAIRKEL